MPGLLIRRDEFLKGYVQRFSGYRQSLVDDSAYQNSIGIRLPLTDWL
jgi:outer membrane phospholipase A